MKNIKPILFATPMVQAILEGRKTQTRRVIKLPVIEKEIYAGGAYIEDRKKDRTAVGSEDLPSKYKKGDILWVRETSAITTNVNHRDDPEWPNRPYQTTECEDGIVLSARIYRADGPWDGFDTEKSSWKPSIFMSKQACRIFLEVTNVKVERLQDISNKDIRKEGAADFGCTTHILNWRSLWEEINGRESWEANPWVWVYEFKRVEQPQNFLS